MAYIAPIFKDRVAIGDDKYIMSDIGNGKISLSSAPDEVLANGTDVNKSLLQPIVDALQILNTDILPNYALTYWKRRLIGGSYYPIESSAWVGNNYEDYIGQYMYFIRIQSGLDQYENLSTNYNYATVQYSQSITVDPSNGVISLVNPSTMSISGSIDSGGSLNTSPNYILVSNTLSGKYIKGIRPNVNAIFYLPTRLLVSTDEGSYMGGRLWYLGIPINQANNDSIKVISSKYTTEYGEWEIVSSDNPTQYPDTSTANGYQWIKLGRIDEYVIDVLSQLDTRLDALESLSAGI